MKSLWSTLTIALTALILILSVVLSRSNPAQLDTSLAQIQSSLQYDFYQDTCPNVTLIIRSTVKDLHANDIGFVPQLLRLFFHDCFVGGCDASIMLDEKALGENRTEKEESPNLTVKGFDKVAIIKAKLEESCPGVVSCADTIAIATREGVLLAGGPYYPVFTGRGDSNRSYSMNTSEIPSPSGNLSITLKMFHDKGFTLRDTVSLLGGHNIGSIGCNFAGKRVFNFNNTGLPDPTMPLDFLVQMQTLCRDNSTRVSLGSEFDSHYFENLLIGKGILMTDQELMNDRITAGLVRLYAGDGTLFRKDFARAMQKLTTLNVLRYYQGGVRFNCSSLLFPTALSETS